MKEQVGVDENDSELPDIDGWKLISPEEFDHYIRLKRLDENRKKEIEILRKKNREPDCALFKNLETIKLLESLDK